MSAPEAPVAPPVCAFCTRDHNQVPSMVYSHHGNVFICEPCVWQCVAELNDPQRTGEVLPDAIVRLRTVAHELLKRVAELEGRQGGTA